MYYNIIKLTLQTSLLFPFKWENVPNILIKTESLLCLKLSTRAYSW